MRRLLVLAALAVVLVPASPASAASTFPFRLEGYANNVKVLPPLVGDYQLGVAKILGSGSAGRTSTSGTFEVRTTPMLPRYAPRWLKASVVTWSYRELRYAHGAGVQRTLVLTVQVTASSHPSEECAPGLRGELAIVDDPALRPNRQNADSITLGKWQGRCNTFVMGWNNTDGGARTRPPAGGPGGGQWAVVNVDAR